MERREFLKFSVGFAAAAGAIAATAKAAQAAPTPPLAGDALKANDHAETSARTEAEKLEHETAAKDGDLAALDGDSDFSARRWWRRRRVYFRRRRRIFVRRRRRFWRRRRAIWY